MSRNHEPPVSVVIPAFNASRDIRAAIETALDQTHPPIEVVVVDDGSDDDTAAIARSVADDRVKVLSGPNVGVSAARNAGVAATTGSLVAFLDADDRWLPDKLRRQIDLFGADPRVGVVGSFMRYVSSSGRSLGVSGEALDGTSTTRLVEGRLMPFPMSSTVFRREVFDRLGGFRTELTQAEDIELISRVARDHRVVCVEEVLGLYRVHPGSATARHFASQRMAMRFVQELRRAEARGETLSWAAFSSSYRPSAGDRYRDRIAALYRSAGVNAAEGRWASAVAAGIGAVALGPHYALGRLRRQRPWARGDGG